ncbi:MAG: apolipoprotein N-acyltransferase [Bacteroidales bacterium]
MKRKRILTLILLSTLGGVISGLAWLPFFTGLFLFISFVPFFLITEEQFPKNNRFGNRLPFLIMLPGFLIFNITAIAWIRIAGVPLLITAIIANSFIMTFTFWLAFIIKQKAGKVTGNASIIIFWLAMEYATNNLSLLSPWLNLGNGLAGETFLLQWYEFTGVAGGTLWILLTNMLLAKAIVVLKQEHVTNLVLKLFFPLILLIAVPPLLSLLLLNRQGINTRRTTEVVLIQPNRDPYTEKFTVPFDRQLEELLSEAAQAVTENTKWIITPETTIDDPVNLSATDADPYVAAIREFTSGTNPPAFVLGAVTSTPGPPVRLHNSALLIRPDEPVTYYHKSKLVPGIERTMGGTFSFLQKIFPNLGGTSGGYHGQATPALLVNNADSTAATPVICFESAFGEHVAGFVRMGADFIIVITNDGWWKGTYGYYQHLTLSRLRAIENRRTVVRVANTGVSAIIDTRGRIIAEIPWWEKGTLNQTIETFTDLTFYTRHGDILGRTSATMALFIIILHLLAFPLRALKLSYPSSSHSM